MNLPTTATLVTEESGRRTFDIIFDRDPDSHFVIDGDLYTALCWSDHQVMVLILLRGTFGVGLRTRSTELGGDSRMHFMMDPSK